MAGQPLSPATDRRLGGPLPHQLANQTRVHLIPPECFHTVSCDTVRLCGFTSRFQLLSPCMRQVTHALLTRPPLNRPEQAPASIVRLACVKHAASVHPEPGSNSLNIVFIHRSSLRCLNRIQSFFLSFFLLFVLCVQSSLLTRFLVFFVVVLFSKTVSPPLSETA